MKITVKEVTVAELFEGYEDNGENGVVGYGGKLDIRPAYQREFVYDEKHRDAVIDTLRKGFPLNVMYWANVVLARMMFQCFLSGFSNIEIPILR